MRVRSIGTVSGTTALPAGFTHPHASEEARVIAEGGMILRVQVTTGRITLPVPEPHRAYLRSVRQGERKLAEVLDAITETEDRLMRLCESPAVPDQPDRRWVDDWLHRNHLNFWTSQVLDAPQEPN